MADGNQSEPSIRLTRARVALLEVFLADPRAERYGTELTELTGVVTGTLYPILNGWADIGWLRFRTEDGAHPGRPPRRYFQMTRDGEQQARRLLAARRPRRRQGSRDLTRDDLMKIVDDALQRTLQHLGVTVQVTHQPLEPGSEPAAPGAHRFLVTTTIE
ncbi:hypothetical protein ACQPZP_39230 [Spirillospora sp. CA-142024]|uniref:hypothetical protein n=1 Tax=Spirillospora sp. CA-142024 TaxID=3240036 RepID=UPI003D8E001C